MNAEYASLRARSARPEVEPVAVVYIGGEGRSGSTLLAALLGNHEGFFPVGEIRDIWQALRTNERCGCGDEFSLCPFWLAVGRCAFGGWDQIDVDAMLRSDIRFARQRRVPRLLVSELPWVEHADLDRYRARLAVLYAAIREVSGCQVIVDSTKDPAYSLLLRGAPGVDVRFAHLVRDSRGVAFSWAKTQVERPEYAQHPVLKDTYMGTRHIWRGALEWDVKNLLFACLTRRSERVVVKYESLVTDPVRELGRIVSLVCGPGRHAEQPARRQFESLPFHTLGGNRVRFRRGPIELRPDEEWRQAMRFPQRLVIGLLTFPLLVAYGYVRNPFQRRHSS